MTSKRRPHISNSLRSPALSRPNRLGEAMARAIGSHPGLATPAMSAAARRTVSTARGSWSGAGQWQHGRVLSHAPEVNTPAWNYPALHQGGSIVAHQGGVALLELMLVIGVIAIGTAGVMATYKVVDANRKINKEVDNAITIAENVVATSAVAGDFHSINQVNALREGVFPADMLNDAGDPKNSWGGDVLLTATDIAGKPDWGTVLTYEGVPAAACSKLVTQAAAGFYAVSVNDTNVRNNYGPVDVGSLAQACTDSSRIQFTYAKHGGAGEYVDPENLAPCTVAPPTTQVITDLACPSGQLGDVTFRTDSVCYSPYGPPTDLPAVRISPDTCAPKCVVPTPSTQNQHETRTANQVLACPPGQSSTGGGNLGITQSRQEQRTRSRSASCPPSPGYSGPVGPAVWTPWSTFGAWQPTTPWTTVSNTCAPTCVAPAPTTQTGNQTGTCATGRVTPAGATTFPQTHTRAVNYSCPGPTGAYDTTYGAWSAWTPAETVACAPQCVLPTPNPQTNTETRTGNNTFTCPTGQVITTAGPWQYQQSGTQTRSEKRTQTRTASCPTPTGAVAWTPWTAWSTWSGTTSWSPAFTCAPACVAPAPTTQTANQTGTCATGRLTPAGSTTFPQTHTRAVNYSCPGPTGAYDTTYGAWSAWTPAETVACAPQCVLPTPNPQTNTETRTGTNTFTCPTGQLITTAGPWQYQQSGTQTRSEKRTQTRTASCPTLTGAVAWTPWTAWSAWSGTTSWSPAFTCASACVAPAPTTESRAGTPETQSQQFSAAGTPETAAGTPNTQVVAGCATNQYGTVSQSQPTTITRSTTIWRTGTRTRTTTQTRTVTYSCAAPTGSYTTVYGAYSAPGAPYGTYSAWTYGAYGAPTAPYGAWSAPVASGAWSNTSSTCKACPATVTETQQNPANPILYNAYSCPAGYYGYYGRSYNQHRTRTRSYNCPAGTTTLPAPTYSPYTGWINGPISTTSNNCVACPAPTTETQTQWVNYNSNNCPAGQYGYNVRQREQSQSRTKSYVCPASTPTLPAATYSAWSAWANTGATRDVAGTNCATCPTLSAETQTQWVNASAACPSGQSGSHTWQAEQRRSRTRSYSCPAGTAALPAITYGTWSAYANTGATRNVVNTCAPTCVPKQTTEYGLIQCSYPQTTTVAGRRQRTAYWTCPGPTITSYSPWVTTEYPQCCPSGRTCSIQ